MNRLSNTHVLPHWYHCPCCDRPKGVEDPSGAGACLRCHNAGCANGRGYWDRGEGCPHRRRSKLSRTTMRELQRERMKRGRAYEPTCETTRCACGVVVPVKQLDSHRGRCGR